MLRQLDKEQQERHNAFTENNDACPILSSPEKIRSSYRGDNRCQGAEAECRVKPNESNRGAYDDQRSGEYKAAWPIATVFDRGHLTSQAQSRLARARMVRSLWAVVMLSGGAYTG